MLRTKTSDAAAGKTSGIDPLVTWMNRPDPFRDIPIPPQAQRVNILGIYYLHFQQPDGGDLYVTKFGRMYLEQLQLENWHEKAWFHSKREKLRGTSTVYKVPSKIINGKSINLVVKWCRVGEEVPLDTMGFNRFSDAEFNSPFEEFSLVMEMRERACGKRIRTNRPLAIYVPPEQLELWQTGRSRSRMAQKKNKYRDVELDILRQYILIYEWVEGVSADEALVDVYPDVAAREEELARLTRGSSEDMCRNGFMVVDHKPAHVILRPRHDGRILRRRTGEYPYALVDFELLLRTTDYESQVEQARRHTYLEHQRERFEVEKDVPVPEYLRATQLMGVDYIWGRAESTHGAVWVVGRRPELFDYFLPERWRHTPRTLLSDTAQTYYTVTKDHINLVWKISRVGETPDIDNSASYADLLVQHGYNSPFEEFALAMELSACGFSVVYPRAVYVAGLKSGRARDYVTDVSRFDSHEELKAPDGSPILSPTHTYITLWGKWKGPIAEIIGGTQVPCTGVDLFQAVHRGLIDKREQEALLKRMTEKLEEAGFTAHLKPSHFLLTLEADGRLRRDQEKELLVTICNFELIKGRSAVSPSVTS